MLSALRIVGLTVGAMDILGGVCFQILIILMIKRLSQSEDLEELNRKTNYYKFYLVLLNIWILVTILMLYGILSHRPSFMEPWLVWSIVGLVLDAIFMFWWCVMLIFKNLIEALSNIFISLLTIGTEFLFIIVIYTIYTQMSEVASGKPLK